MKATTYVPEHRSGWWGGPDVRLRCSMDDKVVFATEQDAQESNDRANDPMTYYLGPCGHWHVTRE